jgi:hypothetical protein
MLRIWMRNPVEGSSRKWLNVDEAEDLADAMRKVLIRGHHEFRVTDERGADLITGKVRQKALSYATTRRRVRIYNPPIINDRKAVRLYADQN